MSSANDARAVVLAGAITSATVQPTAFHLRTSPALRHELRRRREPLDLDANPFRYLISRDGELQPVREVVVTHCRCGGCRR
ncbi:MAG TPA: hypothetical protein VMS98_05515 [Thermoanaerobaculia bacterium]|nr:hypothetical protein [Thermoanaerobaculia bacterium]